MTTGGGDNHIPHENGKWSFDQSVTDNFDQMLRNSIPEYEAMRQLTFTLGKHFVRSIGSIVDIGASRGEAIARFAKAFPDTSCYAVEISEPMLAVMRERFANQPNVSVISKDLRHITPEFSPFLSGKNSLVLSILTLQFVPIEYRLKLMRTLYNSLHAGGALILVEKVLGNTADFDDLFVAEYYNLKNANGYSYEDIQRKRAELEGVLVPVTSKWNEEMLRMSGFNQVDCFYRHLNFAGFLAIKD